MLPQSHSQQYQEFQQILQQLEQFVDRPTCDRAVLKSKILETQEFFHKQIKSLDIEALEAEMAYRSRSLQVEMDKQLRLLNMEVMFLQTARQLATSQHRLSQIKERLRTLGEYCGVMLSTE
ncbi:MAG: heterocyst frequency control protein PatD [Leptolyngbyaceae cyanobacterium CSU_1_3]|nr:heterocyst frequency control protein PatD [Leptolyngbyaceae cyanobacterium CSU_1_3]